MASMSPVEPEPTAGTTAYGGRTLAKRPGPSPAPGTHPVVGREAELAVLRAAFADAEAGRGSVVCVTGEPGVGKTTLVETFLAGLGGNAGIARGRCSERRAATAVYAPVIDALESLVRDAAP